MLKQEPGNIVRMAASIVSAYISRNSLPQSEVPNLISSVHATIASLGDHAAEPPKSEPLRPAVPIKKSYTNDYVICLEDGRKFKSLKRHLRVRYNMTPEQYRAKWGLPDDHPIVAPGYAEIRSRMAKDMGLGQRRRGKG
jgi:MucR family transcriptional regulator, transcriptional regulator of exopolysaccharide biosynthesis